MQRNTRRKVLSDSTFRTWSRFSARPVTLAIGLSVFLVVGGVGFLPTAHASDGTGPVAGTAAADPPVESIQNLSASGQYPANLTHHIEVDPNAAGATVRLRAVYPAGTEREAQRAADGTLEIDWFDAHDRVAAAVNERNVSDERTVVDDDPDVQHLENYDPDEPHGHVSVTERVTWRNLSTAVEPLGPALAAEFRPGDELVVIASHDVEPVRHNAHSVTSDGIANYRYEWTIGDGDEPPEIVFEEGAFEDDSESEPTPIDPAGGLFGSAVAIVTWCLIGRLRTDVQREPDP